MEMVWEALTLDMRNPKDCYKTSLTHYTTTLYIKNVKTRFISFLIDYKIPFLNYFK